MAVIEVQFHPENAGEDARDAGFDLRKHPDHIYRPGDKPGPVSVYWTTASGAAGRVAFEYAPASFGSGVGADGYVGPEPYLCGSVAVGCFARAFASCMHAEAESARRFLWRVSASAFLRIDERIFEGSGWTLRQSNTRGVLQASREGAATAKQALTELYVLLLAAAGDADLTEEGRAKYVREGGAFLAAHPRRDLLIAAVVRRAKDRAALAAAIEEAGGDADEIGTQEAAEDDATAPAREAGEDAPAAGPTLAEARRTWILDRLVKLPPGARVLEVGCGSGWIPQRLAALRPDIKYLGVDPSIRAVADARRYNRRNKATARILQGALGWERLGLAADVPELAERFDALVASEVLEHMPVACAMSGLSRLAEAHLTPDAQVVLTLPNGDYNLRWGFASGDLRHHDHKWEPGDLRLSDSPHYAFEPISTEAHPVHPLLGAPTLGYAGSLDGFLRMFSRIDPDGTDMPSMYGAIPPATGPRPFVVTRGQRMLAFEAVASMLRPSCCYLPPTMAPAGTSARDGYLEHPEDAFTYYRERLGAGAVVAVQEKHMGSRAIVIVNCGGEGAIWTRYGRRFFADPTEERAILAALSSAMWKSGVWDRLSEARGMSVGVAMFDAELMPWGAKARGLIERQYAAAARAGMAEVWMRRSCREDWNKRQDGVWPRLDADAESLTLDYADLNELSGLVALYAGEEGAKPWINVFGLLLTGAQPGRGQPFDVFARWDRDLRETMPLIDAIAAAAGIGGRVRSTATRFVTLGDEAAEAEAVRAWEAYTKLGGEGYVVKPVAPWPRLPDGGLAQPAVKVRGREYLRLVYGPHYDRHLPQLRQRKLEGKRFMALWQQARGLEMIEGLERKDAQGVARALYWLLASSYRPSDPRL